MTYCSQCNKPIWVIREDSSSVDTLCHCEPIRIMSGWICSKCNDLWYMSEVCANDGESFEPDVNKRVYFCDNHVESLVDLTTPWWRKFTKWFS